MKARKTNQPRSIDDARQKFAAAVEAYSLWEAGEPEPVVDGGISISAAGLAVRRCLDIMPGRLCRELADLLPWPACDRFPHEGATYARGAKALRELIGRATI